MLYHETLIALCFEFTRKNDKTLPQGIEGQLSITLPAGMQKLPSVSQMRLRLYPKHGSIATISSKTHFDN